MLETKKFPDLVETSLAYALGAAAALLAFLLVWLICTVAGSYQAWVSFRRAMWLA